MPSASGVPGLTACSPEVRTSSERSPSVHQTRLSAPNGSTMSTVKPFQLPRAVERDVLRADAERHRLAGLGPCAERIAVERQAALAGRERQAVRRLLEPALDEVHARRADEAGDEQVGRAVVEVERRADLLDSLVLHDRDPVGERHRLDLVVGDVDHGRRGEPMMQALDLVAQLVPELGVEVGERLVEQEHGGIPHQSAPDRHALALAAGELVGPPVEQLLDVQHARRLGDPALDLVLGCLRHLEAERQVAAHVHARVERIGLEHHGDAAILGLLPGDVAIADPDLAGLDLEQAGDRVEQRGLAAA